MAVKGSKEMSFEERLEKLEALTQKMEQGATPLEVLLKDYEEGIVLARALETELEQARARMMEVKSGKGGTAEIELSQIAARNSFLDVAEGEG